MYVPIATLKLLPLVFIEPFVQMTCFPLISIESYGNELIDHMHKCKT